MSEFEGTNVPRVVRREKCSPKKESPTARPSSTGGFKISNRGGNSQSGSNCKPAAPATRSRTVKLVPLSRRLVARGPVLPATLCARTRSKFDRNRFDSRMFPCQTALPRRSVSPLERGQDAHKPLFEMALPGDGLSRERGATPGEDKRWAVLYLPMLLARCAIGGIAARPYGSNRTMTTIKATPAVALCT